MSWTDWNTHDPGITVLEVLAYGLATFGVVDLLSRRVRGAPCGRPCAVLVAAGVAAVVAAPREPAGRVATRRPAMRCS